MNFMMRLSQRTTLLVRAVLMAGALVAGVTGEAGAAGNDKGMASDAAIAKPVLTVSVIHPRLENWASVVPVAGEVAAWQEAVIGSELGQQRIVEVNVQVGDAVRKGALLAKIAEEGLAAELAHADAMLAEAESLRTEAGANAERARSLREKGFYSPQQGIQYETAQASAQARRDAAVAARQSARVRLAQTRILAPDDGVISARSASVGSLTAPGVELFRLIRQGRIEWRAEVPEAQVSKLRPGMAARITTVAGDRVAGKVRTVSPSIDPRTRNALVYVDLPPQERAVRAGMFVRGEIELAQTETLTVPQSAVVLRDGFAYVLEVLKVSAGGTAIVRSVKVVTGHRQGERIAVIDGLRRDAPLVASGAGFLADGDTVRVQPVTAGTP